MVIVQQYSRAPGHLWSRRLSSKQFLVQLLFIRLQRAYLP